MYILRKMPPKFEEQNAEFGPLVLLSSCQIFVRFFQAMFGSIRVSETCVSLSDGVPNDTTSREAHTHQLVQNSSQIVHPSQSSYLYHNMVAEGIFRVCISIPYTSSKKYSTKRTINTKCKLTINKQLENSYFVVCPQQQKQHLSVQAFGFFLLEFNPNVHRSLNPLPIVVYMQFLLGDRLCITSFIS